MDRFLIAALVTYLVATTLGLLLRVALVVPVEGLEFGNALHAHSHTLYFGWAALALFTLFFERVGATDVGVRRLAWTVVALGAATFVAFLWRGYGVPGIVVSATSLGIWAWAVAVFLRRARGERTVDVTFLRIALVYVGVACGAALARVAVLALQVVDPLPGDLAVFGFLHAFGAFFLFGVQGLLLRQLAERGARFSRRALRWQLAFATPLAALPFALGVPGGTESAFGPTARLAAVLLVVPGALWLWSFGRALVACDRATRFALGPVWAWWALLVGLGVLGAFGWAEAATRARHPAILYLHVELLGVVSASLLFLVRARRRLASPAPLLVHHSGVAVMVLGLAVAGAPALWNVSVSITLGLWLAALGGALVVLAGGWVLVDQLRSPSATAS